MNSKHDPWFTKTSNNMGFISRFIDSISSEFIKYAALGPDEPALDIGCGNGIVVKEAVRRGVKHIIANDIESTHLKNLHENLSEEEKQHVDFQIGSFPSDLKIKNGSLRAILACRVFHFFDGEKLHAALMQTKRWLKPNGKLFIVVRSPYCHFLINSPVNQQHEEFSIFFERKKKEKAKWPGFISDTTNVIGRSLPPQLHLFDTETLENLLKESGYIVEKCNYMNLKEHSENFLPVFKKTGSVGAIARLP